MSKTVYKAGDIVSFKFKTAYLNTLTPVYGVILHVSKVCRDYEMNLVCRKTGKCLLADATIDFSQSMRKCGHVSDLSGFAPEVSGSLTLSIKRETEIKESMFISAQQDLTEWINLQKPASDLPCEDRTRKLTIGEL